SRNKAHPTPPSRSRETATLPLQGRVGTEQAETHAMEQTRIPAAQLGALTTLGSSLGLPFPRPQTRSRESTMADDFENHCWKDTVPPDVLDIYSHYIRKT